jgi:pyrophosphatase PpaX
MTVIRTVLFDLDGTLIDSIELILASYRHTLRTHGFSAIDDQEWLAGVGRPLRVQLGRWARDPAHMDALVATYRDYNLSHHDTMIRPFDGVSEMVGRLEAAGLRLGVVTSKNREGTRRGLRLAGLEAAMAVLVCADDVTNPKPHPEPVERAVAELGATPETTLFVGDSIHDLHAGRLAGVRTAAALWGPFGRAELEAGAPDWWLERPGDLLALVGEEQ